jgi:hypothetical protein
MTRLKKREGSVLAVVVDEANRSIVFNVAGAAPDGGGKSITLNLTKVHASNVDYAALHGFKQRIGDMAALSRNPDTGLPASPADKFDAVERGVLFYEAGGAEWHMKTTGGGGGDLEMGFLMQALVELKGIDLERARAWVKAKTKAERLALAESKALRPILGRLKAQALEGINADTLLAGLA